MGEYAFGLAIGGGEQGEHGESVASSPSESEERDGSSIRKDLMGGGERGRGGLQ
jgi:hypothetical protein